jgi:hypothetical protein
VNAVFTTFNQHFLREGSLGRARLPSPKWGMPGLESADLEAL